MPSVRGAASHAPCGGDEILVPAASMDAETAEQTPEPISGLDADASADLGGDPRPKALEQGRSPARRCCPVRRSTARAERFAKIGDGAVGEQGADEHRQNPAGAIPTPRKQNVREDGDRLAARLAEVPPDPDDERLPGHEAEDLALIRPMADDSQGRASAMRRMLTGGARSRAQLIDGGKVSRVGKVLDRDGKATYDDHCIVRRGRWVVVGQTNVPVVFAVSLMGRVRRPPDEVPGVGRQTTRTLVGLHRLAIHGHEPASAPEERTYAV